jgi:malic enzyme
MVLITNSTHTDSLPRGRALLRDPRFNRGTAFTAEERSTGTPWDPVAYRGTDYAIGQANNALAYPGIGLGTIVARATKVTDGMLLAAAEAIASLVDVNKPGAGLLPHAYPPLELER